MRLVLPRPRWAWWRAFVRTVHAVRSLDPVAVQREAQMLGARRRWLKPLAWTAGTIAIVFQGLVLLLRNWRLLLLQVVPAAWIWGMSWNVRSHIFSTGKTLPTDYGFLLAAATVALAFVCYWCNATFAFTITQTGRPDIRAAYEQAKTRWRLVSGVALAAGLAQAAVWVWLAEVSVRAFTIGLTVMLVVEIYLFIAVPAWLLGGKPRETRKEALARTATTGALSGVATAPGFLLNRLGLLMLGVRALFIPGVILLSIGVVLHVAASSSVRVVKMSARLGVGAPPGGAKAPPDR